jgi:hypothetical protein
MKAEQILQFVQDVVALGCEICARQHDHYHQWLKAPHYGDRNIGVECQ